jgi:hypothetical protein
VRIILGSEKEPGIMKTILSVLALSAVLSVSAHADMFFVGMDDFPKGDQDFQDLIASINGATIHTNGTWSSLTPSVVKQSGAIFWDNPSADGTDKNIGNYVLGDGGFSGGPVALGLQYLATSTGGMVAFDFTGNATITIIGGITAGTDTLGVCPVVNCNSTDTTWIHGGSLNYVSGSAWELTGTNAAGTQWYSDPGREQTSEFAAFRGSAVPEPKSMALIGAGLIALSLLRKRTTVR